MTRFERVPFHCRGNVLRLDYTLICPSAPSGTLTMLRLASPDAMNGVLVMGSNYARGE